MSRVWIAVRKRERIHDPGQPAIVSENDICIGIEREKRRQCRNAVANIAPHQQAAIAFDIIAERQLRKIALVQRDDHAAQETAEDNAAISFVGSEIVSFSLRVVEFLLPRLHVDIGVGHLSEIDFGTRHIQTGNRALHRHIAENQCG